MYILYAFRSPFNPAAYRLRTGTLLSRVSAGSNPALLVQYPRAIHTSRKPPAMSVVLSAAAEGVVPPTPSNFFPFFLANLQPTLKASSQAMSHRSYFAEGLIALYLLYFLVCRTSRCRFCTWRRVSGLWRPLNGLSPYLNWIRTGVPTNLRALRKKLER